MMYFIYAHAILILKVAQQPMYFFMKAILEMLGKNDCCEALLYNTADEILCALDESDIFLQKYNK